MAVIKIRMKINKCASSTGLYNMWGPVIGGDQNLEVLTSAPSKDNKVGIMDWLKQMCFLQEKTFVWWKCDHVHECDIVSKS